MIYLMERNQKYNHVGSSYNGSRSADPYIISRLLDLLNAKKDQRILDIGCGTGNYTISMYNNGVQIFGVDPSISMLEMAKHREKQIEWRLGSAENCHLNDNCVDGIIGVLTLHHWDDLEKGLLELSRIIKAKGRIIFFTSSPFQMKGYWLNYYFPSMMKKSMLQMPSYSSVEKALRKAGFIAVKNEKYFVQTDLEDYFLYCGKENPELYLDEKIRRGISSFSMLSNQTEVQKGLMKLESDIQMKKINAIMEEYKNDHGDYQFIYARKDGRKKNS
jgi:ubiquinone/menaquinone biosynthesis C-methylase UbiE